MKNLFFILFFLSSFCQGQENFFQISSENKDQLQLGEPVKLKLSLSFPASISSEKIQFPLFKPNDTLGNGWEIWQVDSLNFFNSENENGGILSQFTQTIEIANFDTGSKEIPGLTAIVDNKSIVSNSLSFFIKSVELTDDETIKNIKDLKLDPLTLFEKVILWIKKNWMFIALFGLLILVGSLLYKRYIKKSPQKTEIKEPSIPYADLLLEKLDKIEKKKLWQNGKYKQYFTNVNDIGREFIEFRYDVSTFEKTSNEIISSLKLSAISNDWMVKIEKFFIISDLVKFAKQIPTENENLYAISTIRELIQKERNDIETQILAEK